MTPIYYGVILRRAGVAGATYTDVGGEQTTGLLSGTPAGLTGHWSATELRLGLASRVAFHVVVERDGNLGDVTVSFSARLSRGPGVSDTPRVPVTAFNIAAGEWVSSATIADGTDSAIFLTPNFALLDDPILLVSGAGSDLTAGESVTVICTVDQ